MAVIVRELHCDAARKRWAWTAPWFTFAAFKTRKGADLSSYGVVRMLDEECWEPRVGAPDGVWGVFRTRATRYGTG